MKIDYKILFATKLLTVLVGITVSSASTLKVHFMAGQSNTSGYGDFSDGAYQSNQAIDSQVLYYYHVDTAYGTTGTGGVSDGVETLDTYRLDGGQNAYSQYNESLGTYDSANGTGRWGAEIAFGRGLATNTNDTHAIVKISEGGTSLYEHWNTSGWDPGSNPDVGGVAWQTWLGQTSASLDLFESAGYDVEIASFTWLQGEADSFNLDRAAAYAGNFSDLVTAVLNYFEFNGYSTEDTILMNNSFSHLPDTYVDSASVRTAQQDVMDQYQNGFYIDNSEYSDESHYFDRIHYNGDTLNAIGSTMADVYINNSGSVPEPSMICLLGVFNLFLLKRRVR